MALYEIKNDCSETRLFMKIKYLVDERYYDDQIIFDIEILKNSYIDELIEYEYENGNYDCVGTIYDTEKEVNNYLKKQIEEAKRVHPDKILKLAYIN